MENKNNSQKQTITVKDLHPKEVQLIIKMRTEYRYGTIEIKVEDGIPKQIVQTVRRELL